MKRMDDASAEGMAKAIDALRGFVDDQDEALIIDVLDDWRRVRAAEAVAVKALEDACERVADVLEEADEDLWLVPQLNDLRANLTEALAAMRGEGAS